MVYLTWLCHIRDCGGLDAKTGYGNGYGCGGGVYHCGDQHSTEEASVENEPSLFQHGSLASRGCLQWFKFLVVTAVLLFCGVILADVKRSEAAGYGGDLAAFEKTRSNEPKRCYRDSHVLHFPDEHRYCGFHPVGDFDREKSFISQTANGTQSFGDVEFFENVAYVGLGLSPKVLKYDVFFDLP